MNTTRKLPTINTLFGKNNDTKALIDTGSTRSLISKDFFTSIKSNYCVKSVSKINSYITSASNTKITIRQEAKVHFKVHSFSWTHTFWICNQLPYDVILGYDFCKHSQMLIDFGNNIITFQFSEEQINCAQTEIKYDETLISLDSSHLTPEQSQRFDNLLKSYGDVFTTHVGRAKCVPYEIKIKNEPPTIQSRPYQFTPDRMKALKNIISRMLDQNIIEHSNSPMASPAFLVPKRNKTDFRLVCDFRKINNHIQLDLTPPPNIENIFQFMQGATYFTSFDLNEAFHQIPITESSKQYTAFTTPYGIFHYNTIPQGIRIGTQALQRLTQNIFSHMLYQNVLIFADDLVIFSNTAQDHYKHVQEVLNILRKANLTVNPSKVKLAQNGVHFLGFIVKDSKIYVDPSRTEAIRSYPRPTNLKSLQRFLGMISFFGKFLPGKAEISAPLNRLKRKGIKFKFGKAEQESFDKLKQMVISPTTLHLPDYSKKFVLYTDASENGLGASLGQLDSDGLWYPCAFASRTLTDAESGYSVFRKEVLACVWACERFQPILADQHFIIRTDNEAMSQVLNTDKKVGQFARWKLRLSQFDFEIQHVRATQNLCADALSRMFQEPGNTTLPSTTNSQNTCNILHNYPEFFENIAEHQKRDNTLGPIIHKLTRKIPVSGFELKKGILKYSKTRKGNSKIVVPQNMQHIVMSYYHDSPVSGHLGIKKTIARITRDFIWEGIFKHTKAYVQSCHTCQISKQAQTLQYGLMLSKPAEEVFERLYIDFFGPLQRSKKGNVYILTILDSFSKFVFLRPLRTATSESVINELKDNIFSQHGIPKYIVSDHGSQFTSAQFKNFLFGLGIKHVTTSVAHPQANRSERNNKNLKTCLKMYHAENQSTWDQHLAYLTMAFNSATHEGHQRTPSSIFLGRELNHPLKLLWNIENENTEETMEEKIKSITKELHKTHQKTKARYDKNRKPSPFVIDDLVLYKQFVQSNKAKKINHKLTHVWRGPYVVIEIPSEVNVKIQLVSDPSQTRVAHVSQIKKYYQRVRDADALNPNVINEL